MPRLVTYKDLLRHSIDFLGANVTEEAKRDARRAVQAGYRELGNAARWSYYYQRGRLTSQAPYTTGTVTYSQATFQLTLTGGTWPANAQYGTLILSPPGAQGPTPYQVASRVSGTVLTLAQASNPGADFTTPLGFTLYRDTYPLPIDFLAMDRLILLNTAWSLWFEHPGVWLERQRIYRSPAMPRSYTITGDPHYFGAMAVRLFPMPDQAYSFDFIYQRRPRDLLTEEVNAGTASSVLGSATVTGTGTSWTSSLVGSVLRLSADNVNLPDGVVGAHPAALERVVTAVASATSLTVDLAADITLTNVKVVLSDPADVEYGAMLTALLRACEWQIAIARSQKIRGEAWQAYKEALIQAREADARNFAPEVAGGQHAYPYRLAQMPGGPDVS